MVNHDYMSVQEKLDVLFPPTFLEKLCRGWNRFFEIEHEPKSFKIFFACFMGALIGAAILGTYLIVVSGTFNVN